MHKKSLKEQVDNLCESHHWRCLSHVYEALGAWGVVQWECREGHRFTASTHVASRYIGCPTCQRLRITEATRAAKAKPVIQKTEFKFAPPMAEPLEAVCEVVVDTRASAPVPEITRPRHTKKTKKKCRKMLRSGVIQ